MSHILNAFFRRSNSNIEKKMIPTTTKVLLQCKYVYDSLSYRTNKVISTKVIAYTYRYTNTQEDSEMMEY